MSHLRSRTRSGIWPTDVDTDVLSMMVSFNYTSTSNVIGTEDNRAIAVNVHRLESGVELCFRLSYFLL